MTDENIFAKAIELPEEQRADYLNEVFHDRPDEKARIEAMIRAHGQTDSLLDEANYPTTAALPASDSVDSQQIGPYKLLDKIGEGGMGSVYMAEQLSPVKRMVALKVIRAGLDSKQVVARFEAERQSLAMMDHPNIAKVLDAGQTERGEPYFVMELVKGVPITRYCDDNRLSPKERVKLMVDVCSAVQHAHQKGIIHRDLKPSNILVAQYDDRPVPKVIDFGVAKATHQKLTEKTLYTQLGQIVGTLEYMSPEQAVLNQLDVDTRTDVYSLGVVLYELLIGETPLDGKELRSQGLEQMLRTIREKEPQRPSLRLSSQGKAATQTAAYRKTDQSTLSRTLRGDLDWIVMKALEKDRTRRYDSASRLSEDLNSYLTGQTVDARPPSVAYLAQKKWQQNRGLISSFTAIAIVLLGALVFAISQQRTTQIALEENQELVRNLHDRIIDEVFVAIMSGDATRASDAIDQAISAGVDDQWIQTFRGQLAFFSGNPQEAIEILEPGEERSIPQLGLLSFAYLYEGDIAAWARIDGQLDDRLRSKRDRLSALDKLFAVQTISQDQPRRGLALLEEAKAERDLPLTRLIYADALALHAMHYGEVDSAANAVKQIEIAMEFAGETPYLVTVYLWVRHVALAVGVQDRSSFSIPEIRQFGSSVKNVPVGRMLLVRLLADLDATEACDQIHGWSTNPTDFEIGYYAPILLLQHTPSDVLKTLEGWDISGPMAQAAYARTMALEPTHGEAAIQLANRVIDEDTGILVRTHCISTLALLNATADLRQRRRELIATSTDSFLNLDEVLDFLLGGDESQLPKSNHESEWADNELLFAACFRMIAESDPNTLRQIEACVQSRKILAFNYYWGRALLRLAGDGFWEPFANQES